MNLLLRFRRLHRCSSASICGSALFLGSGSYVPVLCEFLSQVPLDVGRPVLVDAAPILRLLYQRLAERGSAYAAVFGALLDLAGEQVEPVARAVPQPLDFEEELARIDAEWAEEPVTFGADDPVHEPQRVGGATTRRV